MDNLKEHFRGVVWPREEAPGANGKPVYRYVVVGMLVTDTPIPGLDPNETVIDGTIQRYASELGIAGALERLPKFKPAQPLGDATNVVLSLDDIVGKPLRPKAARKTAQAPSGAGAQVKPVATAVRARKTVRKAA